MNSTAPSPRKVDQADVSRILNVVRNVHPVAAPVAPVEPAQRAEITPRVETAPRPEPVMRAVEPAPEVESATDEQPKPKMKIATDTAPKPRRAKQQGVISEKPFEIAAGQGTTALTVRVSNDLHARLKLIATRNQLARNGSPSTINALVTSLIESGIELQEAA
jgi:outer membrane biosynthesis protein TonB